MSTSSLPRLIKIHEVVLELKLKGVEPRRGEIGPVAVLNKYSIVK